MIIVPGRRRRDRRPRAARAADRDAEGRLDARARRRRREVLEFATGPGFFQVLQDRAIALVDDAVKADEIDDVRARRAARGGAGGARRRSSAASRRPTAGRSSSASGTPRTSSRSSAARRGSVRVAALPDVHGNAAALEAVLAEVRRERVDAIVFCGDLTWGPLPNETLELVRAITLPTHFVRGNADRMRRQRRKRARRLARGAARRGGDGVRQRLRRRTSSSTWTASGRRASCTARRAATRSA